jgi:hypothetical protein
MVASGQCKREKKMTSGEKQYNDLQGRQWKEKEVTL